MPRLDFICNVCNHVEHDVVYSSKDDFSKVAPEHCNEPMQWIPGTQAVNAFEPFETRNIDPNGDKVMIRTKADLVRHCNENGLVHLPEPDKVMDGGKLVPKDRTGVRYFT